MSGKHANLKSRQKEVKMPGAMTNLASAERRM